MKETAHAIAAGFRQGQRVVPKVAAVLAALARMGVVSIADGDQGFIMKRVV